MKWKSKRLWDWTFHFTILTGWLSGCWLSEDCWAWSGLWWDLFLMKTSKWHSRNNFFWLGKQERELSFYPCPIIAFVVTVSCSFKTWMMWPCTPSPLRNKISAKNDGGGVLNLFLSKDHKTTLAFCQVIILLYTSSKLTKSSTLLSTLSLYTPLIIENLLIYFFQYGQLEKMTPW